MNWALYIPVGLVAGFFSGVLGIGGGILIVPAIYYISILAGIPEAQAMQQAIATSLVVMIFSSLSSSFTHILKKGMLWSIFKWMLVGICTGAVLGPLTSVNLSPKTLKHTLAILEIFMSLLIWIRIRTQAKAKEGLREPIFHPLIFIFLGMIISFLASILGIGGGFLIVPILILLHYSPHKAIATSAMCVVPSSFIASITYFLVAKSLGYVPFYTLINLPAFVTLTLSTLIATPLGALSCYRIPNRPLRMVFALFLLLIGLSFFIFK
jgi:uncharacterized membrane protein YfcA